MHESETSRVKLVTGGSHRDIWGAANLEHGVEFLSMVLVTIWPAGLPVTCGFCFFKSRDIIVLSCLL